MVSSKFNNKNLRPERRGNFLIPIFILWGLFAVLALGFLWYENGLGDSLKSYYLLPWAFLAGVQLLFALHFLYRPSKKVSAVWLQLS